VKKKTVFETEEYQICLRIRHLDLRITKARRIELEHLDITPPQIGILHFIQKFTSPCTVLELRRYMIHSNSSIMALLNRMEKKGLLRRQPDTKNKRYTRIVLTEQGKALYQKAMSLNTFKEIVSCLPLKDQDKLKEYVELMIDAAERHLETQKNNKHTRWTRP
jgi:DNA-binding MarR family transcriptional regulator